MNQSDRYKLLLVDDTATVRMYERLVLGSEPFDIQEAENGEVALEKVKNWMPDAVLLDIMMPGIDGIEVCRQIKNNPTTADICVIMVTTKGEQEKIAEAFEAGCDDYVTKPISKVELVQKLRKHLAARTKGN